MARVEIVEFQGVKFRRYPDSDRWADRVYFTPGIADKQRGVHRLHEEIWMAANGPIPDGHHIHHVDHDPLNNDPSNLACITSDEHKHHHANDPQVAARRLEDEWQEHLEQIRPLAAAWHSSPEGLKWHSEHGKKSWEGREPKPAVCEQCGRVFESLMPGRFCSNACKSAWRRDSGLDNEERACELCGSPFTVNRYSRARFCSRSCGSKAKFL